MRAAVSRIQTGPKRVAHSPSLALLYTPAGSIKRKQAGQARKATPLSSAKLADRPAAAAAPAADAWSISAVQRCGSVCTDAAHQAECMDMTAYPAAPASPASEGSAGPSTAAASPLPILDLEITAEEVSKGWLRMVC